MSDTSTGDRPFTEAVKRKRRQGLRYQDLEQQSDRAYSTAWFNNLVNASDPWAVNPPTRSFAGLCKLFGVDEVTLRQWIAQEWYSVKVADYSTRVVALAGQIDQLSPAQAELIAGLIAELVGGSSRLSITSPPKRVVRRRRRMPHPSVVLSRSA